MVCLCDPRTGGQCGARSRYGLVEKQARAGMGFYASRGGLGDREIDDEVDTGVRSGELAVS